MSMKFETFDGSMDGWTYNEDTGIVTFVGPDISEGACVVNADGDTYAVNTDGDKLKLGWIAYEEIGPAFIDPSIIDKISKIDFGVDPGQIEKETVIQKPSIDYFARSLTNNGRGSCLDLD